jgi:N-acetylglucosamine-6-sulfatase
MPLIVRYPKMVKAGSKSDWMINNTDFAPTMLALAGVKTPDYMQGHSIVGALKGEKEPEDWRKGTYYRYWMHMAHHDNPGHVGIRTREFKLIFYYGADYKGEYRTPPAWELYDLKNDPTEVVNQYDNPEYASVVQDLKEQLAALRQRVGDTGQDYPAVEKIVQEFWDYDAADRAKAEEISTAFLKTRLGELEKRNP